MVDQETSSVHLTVQQAARHVGVSAKTIRRWLSSGRLVARFDGQAYAIDQAEVERAAAAGRPVDVHPAPHRGPGHVNGHVRSLALVQELLDRLERQAGEIVALRIERDQLADELRALRTPGEADPSPNALCGPADTAVAEPAQQSTDRRRPWWRFW